MTGVISAKVSGAAALDSLVGCISRGAVDIVDLTAPLDESTPVIELPSDRGRPWPFERTAISRFDELGPDVYWNNLRMSEHTGTHFDAPVHWRSGRHLHDVSQVPPTELVGPGVVVDMTAATESDPDFLLRRSDVENWMATHGPLPDGGWLLYRTGWEARGAAPESFLNDGHTPGVDPGCARWLATQTGIVGIGVETVGTDAGQAHVLEPPYPCHWFLQGAGKYGLTQLRNLSRLPARGSVVVAAPLPIVGGSGSPCRVLALVPRTEGVT